MDSYTFRDRKDLAEVLLRKLSLERLSPVYQYGTWVSRVLAQWSWLWARLRDH